MLEGKGSTFPSFQCPNCRAYWDLTADVDVEMDDVDDDSEESATNDTAPDRATMVAPPTVQTIFDPNAANGTLLSRRQAANPGSPEITHVSNAIDVPQRISVAGARLDTNRTLTPDGDRIINGEGPLTPRNDVGPFILDGSAGRASGRRISALPEIFESAPAN